MEEIKKVKTFLHLCFVEPGVKVEVVTTALAVSCCADRYNRIHWLHRVREKRPPPKQNAV